MTPRRIRIVSGGQTGVDRAALDAALEAGVPCGGWCPAGRLAEDGVIDAAYPLLETASSDVSNRTLLNVEDSDGTVVFGFSTNSPGTALTVRCATMTGKPLLLLDDTTAPPMALVDKIAGFVESFKLRTLNVAGPRASEAPEAYDYVRRVLTMLFRII